MNEQIDIITDTDEETNKTVSWGILHEDGSVEWFDTEEEAESNWIEEGN